MHKSMLRHIHNPVSSIDRGRNFIYTSSLSMCV